MKDSHEDLKIYGNMSISGGKYNDVIIHGRGVIQSELTARNVKVNGNMVVNGSLKAEELKINGSGKICEKSDVDSVEIYGHLKSTSSLQSSNIKCHGGLNVDGDLCSSRLDIQGEMKVKENCSADELKIIGNIKIGKELNADNINIQLYKKSEIQEIVGGKIKIGRMSENKISRFFQTIFLVDLFKNASLVVDTIEGDEIILENTKASVIRGKNINIGKGCVIDYLEYSGALSKSDNSEIKEEKKI